MKIDNATRKLIKEWSGIRYVKILRLTRDSHGYPNFLLRGKDHNGVEWRGWLNEGESHKDIIWDCENVDGWEEELSK